MTIVGHNYEGQNNVSSFCCHWWKATKRSEYQNCAFAGMSIFVYYTSKLKSDAGIFLKNIWISQWKKRMHLCLAYFYQRRPPANGIVNDFPEDCRGSKLRVGWVCCLYKYASTDSSRSKFYVSLVSFDPLGDGFLSAFFNAVLTNFLY